MIFSKENPLCLNHSFWMCFLLIELLKIASLYNRREKSIKKDSIEILAKNHIFRQLIIYKKPVLVE